MVACKSDILRDRYNELLEVAKNEICAQLNSEFEERIYVLKGELYVDCSDFSQRDVKIS